MATATASAKSAAAGVLSLKVTLRDTKPPVWRRLLAPGTMTLAALHRAIQASMGWYDCHLHSFEIDGRHYSAKDMMDAHLDERRVTLNSLLKIGVDKFRYTYDFGDGWDHAILIEKSVAAVPGQHTPACIAGKRNCPPEDCGGAWGYAELLEILADPAHPEHDGKMEWLDGGFDPEAFSVGDANERMQNWVDLN